MKVALINGWSDDNKGDAAIVQGLLRLLRNAHAQRGAVEPLHFAIVSSFGSDAAGLLAHHYRHTAPPGSGIEVCGALLPTTDLRARSAWARRACLLAQLGRAVLLLALAPLYRNSHRQWGLSKEMARTVRTLQEADVVISKGGHVYFATGSLSSWVGLFRHLFPLYLAQALTKPTVIYGQSIGPVHGRIPRALLRRGLRRSQVFVREPLSLDVVAELLGPAETQRRCTVVWDTAFALESAPLPESLLQQLPPRFVAMTVRQWHFPYDDPVQAKHRYTQYLQTMAGLIRRINREWSLPVVLVPQVLGPTPAERDLVAAEQLRSYAGDAEYVEIGEDLSPGQLRALYGRAEILIGTRFHSVILALTAGTPALAISYHGYKATGIMNMLGREELVFRIENLCLDDLWSRAQEVWEHRDAYRTWLVEQNERIRRESAATAVSLLESLGR